MVVVGLSPVLPASTFLPFARAFPRSRWFVRSVRSAFRTIRRLGWVLPKAEIALVSAPGGCTDREAVAFDRLVACSFIVVGAKLEATAVMRVFAVADLVAPD